MTHSLADTNVVLIIANGFNEAEFTEIQRALLKAGAKIKTVAPENSLANGWLGKGWGHYFPVDQNITEALASDYDQMILVGGERGVAKLQQNPHTKRMVGHFLDAHKPLIAINEAVSLLSLPGKITGRAIAANPDDAQMIATGAKLSDEDIVTDGPLMTTRSNDIAAVVAAVLSHLAETRELVAA